MRLRKPEGWSNDQIRQYYSGRVNDQLDRIVPIWDRNGAVTINEKLADLIEQTTYTTNIDMIIATKVIERNILDNDGYLRYTLPIVPEDNEERYVHTAALQPIYNRFAYIRSAANYAYLAPISGIVKRIPEYGGGEMAIFMNAVPQKVKTDQTRLTDWFGDQMVVVNTRRNRVRRVERNAQRTAVDRATIRASEMKRREDRRNGIV